MSLSFFLFYFVANDVIINVTEPTYHLTTEYDLETMLNNSDFYINEILIERNKDYAFFILDENINVDIDNSNNYQVDNLYNETNSKYFLFDFNLFSKDIELDSKKYFKLNFERGAGNRIINKYQNYNGTYIKYIYFDESETILKRFGFYKVIPYILTFIILRGLLISLLPDKKELENIMVGNMDMQNVTKKVDTRFSDIAGMSEAKEHISKYVDIIKNREKYDNIGAKIPKGVLLCGPPGCGKTLLAKAVAGESEVSFIATSGSDFDEIYVGVGASRVKKLFDTARKLAPSIIFIDEIDSIGEKRSNEYSVNRNPETLNKILMEMDGFKNEDNIMVLASTNRDNVLDSALLRSGRFDAKIYVDLPNKNERIDIFKLYLNKIKLNDNIDIELTSEKLSKMTPTMSGADIANICNQAALNAISDNIEKVELRHLINAIDDIGIGIEKKSRKSEDNHIKTVAYHESGHALMGYILKNGKSPVKLSITPRGHGNLGYTQPYDNESSIIKKEEYIADIYSLLAGRGAEIIKFNLITSGASNDFEKATRIIELMITKLGMYKEFAPTVYNLNRNSTLQLSEAKRKDIEDFIQLQLKKIFNDVLNILEKNKSSLEKLAEKLLVEETIEYDEIKNLLPNMENSLEI